MIDKPNLTETEIQENYQEFIEFVGTTFTGERKDLLLKMYDSEQLGLSVAMSPASSVEHYHLCHPGGYLQHIMHVIKLSFAQKKVFEVMGCKVDWTDEEMIFAAMHHDLGKAGDPEFGDYYSNQVDDWQRRRGILYKLNPNLPYMEVPDRAIYLLQKYGVKMTWKEYLGIKLSDGMYSESAAKYLKQMNPDMNLKTELPRVIHLADYTACSTERNIWMNSKEEVNL